MTAHVMTLIAGGGVALTPEHITATEEALFSLGATIDGTLWLASDVAADILFHDLNGDQADAAARQVLGDGFDVIAQLAPNRRKALLVADMESTMIRNEMLDELAEIVGLRREIAAVTARAMNGELDFEAALDARIGLLHDLDEAAIEQAKSSIEEMPGARTLVRTMQAAGAVTVLVSGGFRHFTGYVRDRLGMDLDFANELEIVEGRLSGKVRRPILGADAKRETLLRLAVDHRLSLEQTVAVGDGANDIAMLAVAGLGVAYHAKPVVLASARWRLVHADLTGLLYAQGFRREEFRE